MIGFRVSMYAGEGVYAWLDDRQIASLFQCPLGVAIRWYQVESGQPGATEIAPDMEAAKALVEQWAAGLEIQPWD